MSEEQTTPGKIRAQRIPDTRESMDRHHERYALEFEISAQILIPEDTFHPRYFMGQARDVSATGMKIVLEEIPIELYHKLLMRTRYIRMIFMNPVTRNEVKITGRIMWIDYHKASSVARSGPCFLGVYLDKGEGVDLTEYHKMITGIEPI